MKKWLINMSLMAALVLVAAGGNAVASTEPNAANCIGYATLKSGAAEDELNVGRVMLHGFMCPRSPSAAVQLSESAAKKGNAEAMVELGALLSDGKVVAKDMKRAYELFKRAADAGNVKGKTGLGWMMVYGDPAKKNIKKGMQYLMAGARGGDPVGQRYYALALVDESITSPAKFEEASGWFRRAAEQLDAESAKLLELFLDTGRITADKGDDIWNVIENAKTAEAAMGDKGQGVGK